MKSTLTPNAQKLRYFKAVRALALIALVCTVLLAAFILIQSVLPAGASSSQSGIVGDVIQSIVGKGDEELDNAMSAFGSFSAFVRKGLGHFLLFAILGTGLTASSFLLIKPRALYPFISLLSGLLIAMLSEMLQLPIFTQGRAASWTDVGIDVFGTVCGIAFASLLLWLYVLIKKLADKDGYSLLRTAFFNHTFSFATMKGGTVAATYDDEYVR